MGGMWQPLGMGSSREADNAAIQAADRHRSDVQHALIDDQFAKLLHEHTAIVQEQVRMNARIAVTEQHIREIQRQLDKGKETP